MALMSRSRFRKKGRWRSLMSSPCLRMPKNKDEAYQFLNYLLRPDVVAHISDHVFYANANKAATPLVSAEVRDNPGIYPPADVRAKLFTLKVQDRKSTVCAPARGPK